MVDESLSINELRKLAISLKLPGGGKKIDLIERINKFNADSALITQSKANNNFTECSSVCEQIPESGDAQNTNEPRNSENNIPFSYNFKSIYLSLVDRLNKILPIEWCEDDGKTCSVSYFPIVYYQRTHHSAIPEVQSAICQSTPISATPKKQIAVKSFSIIKTNPKKEKAVSISLAQRTLSTPCKSIRTPSSVIKTQSLVSSRTPAVKLISKTPLPSRKMPPQSLITMESPSVAKSARKLISSRSLVSGMSGSECVVEAKSAKPVASAQNSSVKLIPTVAVNPFDYTMRDADAVLENCEGSNNKTEAVQIVKVEEKTKDRVVVLGVQKANKENVPRTPITVGTSVAPVKSFSQTKGNSVSVGGNDKENVQISCKNALEGLLSQYSPCRDGI